MKTKTLRASFLNRRFILPALATLAMALAAPSARAIDYTNNATGNWSATTIWTPNGTPGKSDNVTILSSTIVTNNSQSCSNITVQSSGTLAVQNVRTMVVYGNITNNGTIRGSGASSVLEIAANCYWMGSGDISTVNKLRLTIDSGVTLTVDSATTIKLFNQGITVMVVNGILDLSTGGMINPNGSTSCTNNGTILCGFTNSSVFGVNGTAGLGAPGGWANFGGSLILNGSAAQTLSDATAPPALGSLTVTNASGVSLGAATTVTNLTLTSGQLNLNSKTLTLPNGANVVVNNTSGGTAGSLSGAPSFGTSVNLTYTGTGAISTGPEIPSTTTVLNNLTINNSAGVTLGTSATVNGSLTLTSGNLTSTSSQLLTLASGASYSGISTSRYIVGPLAMVYGATGSKTFPIGYSGSSDYHPVSVNLTTIGSGTPTISVTPNEPSAWNGANTPANTTMFTNRNWTVNTSDTSGDTATITVDGTGWPTPTTAKLVVYNGSTTAYAATFSSPNYTAAGVSLASGNNEVALGDFVPTSPALNAGAAVADFGNVAVNRTSVTNNYVLSGLNLNGSPVTVSPPANFEVSLDRATWTANPSSLNISYTAPTLNNTTVYVRFKPTAVQAYSGSITNAGGGAASQITAVSGTGTAPAEPTLGAAVSGTTINLTIGHNAAGNNVVVVYNTSGLFSTPSGAPPAPGISFAGGTLLTNTTGTSYAHTSLAMGTYYYQAWSYDSTGNFYSPVGVTTNAYVAGVYYSQSSSDPADSANWNTAPGGGGTTPANFTSGDTFIITNGYTMTASATPWTVSGNGAKVVVENGGTLAANNVVTVPTLQVKGGGAVNASAVPNLVASTLQASVGTGAALVNSSLFVTNLLVDASASLTVAASQTLEITNSVANSGTVNLNGTLKFDGTNAWSPNGTLTVNNGGVYMHNANGGTIPTATWNTGSECLITGAITNTPAGLNQSFYNFTWNCASQTNDVSLLGALTNVNGNLTFTSTGTKTVILNGNTNQSTMAVGGNLNVSGGTCYFVNSAGTTETINLMGDLNISSTGTLRLQNGTAAGARIGVLNLSGNFNQTGGTFAGGTGNGNGSQLNFTGGSASVQFTQSAGTFSVDQVKITVASGKSLTLNNDLNIGGNTPNTAVMTVNGTLLCNGYNVTGQNQFTLSGGATLGLTDPAGLVANGYTAQVGTITAAAATNLVTGSNTVFTSLSTGQVIFNAAGAYVGVVSSVTDDTNLTLTANAKTGVAAGAWVASTNPGSGNIRVVGQTTYSSAANYIYNGSSAQATGNGLPATINNLTISNSAGVSLSQAMTNSGVLYIQSGTLTPVAGLPSMAGALTFDGSNYQNSGSWGSSSSTATHKNDTYFVGSGIVNVLIGPDNNGAATYFRSAGSGNWNAASTWQASFDLINWGPSINATPGATNNIYIQTTHKVTLTGNQACGDLNICATSATGAGNSTTVGVVALGTNTLSLNGKLRCYTNAPVGTVPGSSSTNGFGVYPFTAGAGGKVSVVGNSRNLTAVGEWSNTISTPTNGSFPLSIDLNSGQTAALNTYFKCSSLVVNSGTLDAQTNRLAIDAGSTPGTGDVTINSGATLRSAMSGSTNNQVVSATGTTRGGTLTVNTNGTLVLSGAAPCIDMNAVVLNGTVQYSGTAQTLAQPSGVDALAVGLTNYGNLNLAGSGTKTLLAGTPLTVKGILTVSAGTVMDFNTNKVSAAAVSLNSSGGLLMEVTKTNGTFIGSQLTNTSGTLTYAGALTVTAAGDLLASGDSIGLFVSSGGFGGGFSSVTAPTQSGVTANTGQLTGGTGGNLTYSSATSSPTLTSVTPNPVTGSSYLVPLTLTGSGFTGATAVLLTNLTTSTGASQTPTVNSDTSISVSFVPGVTASSWNATVVNGSSSGQAGFTVSVPAKATLAKTGLTSAGAGKLVLNGSGGTPGYNYAVLVATNLAAPVTWTPTVTNTFDGSGNFSYTNAVSGTNKSVFFRIGQ